MKNRDKEETSLQAFVGKKYLHGGENEKLFLEKFLIDIPS
jgi:hypothetical protein